MSSTTDPTREELIKLCDDGIVPHDKWRNRDSSSAQTQLAHCRAFLAAGCDFFVTRGKSETTWTVIVEYKGFNYFEYGSDVGYEDERFYVPTRERLDRNKGDDWY